MSTVAPRDVYVYHHLGLGDHVIANGIVRTFAEEYDRVFLFVKPKFLSNIQYLYRGQPNIKLMAMDDAEARSFISWNTGSLDIKIIGHWAQNNRIFQNDGSPIDEIFYDIAGVPFENKWDKFHINRNLEREQEVFDELGLEGQEYIFVHDDEKRKITRLPKGIRVVRPAMNVGIFEYMKVIEYAQEFHAINSCFYCLVDCALDLHPEENYLHAYTQPEYKNHPGYFGNMKLDWKLLE